MTARLEEVAAEFVAYWERAGGCGMCGGLPHAATCFVRRFRSILEAAAQEGETPVVKTPEYLGDRVYVTIPCFTCGAPCGGKFCSEQCRKDFSRA